MFRKLRVKFVAITMVMVAIVIALAFAAVCVVEHQRSYSVVQTALYDATEQAEMDYRAEMAHGQFRQDGPSAGGDEGFREGFQQEPESGAPPFIGRLDDRPRSSSSFIPVAAYRIDADGTASLIPSVTSASIAQELLDRATASVADSDDGMGTLADLDLHYVKRTVESTSFVVFTDTSYTDSWKSLAPMLALVGLATLAVFLVIAVFYSGWALRPVKEAWDSQRQFVADASHDLKTPLTVILANTSILMKHPERSIASQSQWVESTQAEALSMQGLVTGMLDLAQVEAGESVPVEKEVVDYSDLVDGQTLMFDSVALEHGCSFECGVQGAVRVLGNEVQLKKMTSTILENAFKYVEPRGEVDVTLSAAGKVARLAVRNTGTPISAEDLPHIFDRFYRTDKARTSGAGGYGLGLAIAREIARQHGGDITCASSADEGTTFTVTLPLHV